MKKYSILLFLCFLAFNIIAQEKYEGVVYDVGNRKIIEGVVVKSSTTNIVKQTDENGFFSMFLNSSNNHENVNNEKCSVINNTVFWNFKTDVNINLYSLNSTIIFSTSSTKNGQLQLQIPAVGYYALSVESNENDFKFLLFSDGKDIKISNNDKYSIPSIITDSSLVFSKDNYFEREYSLSGEGEFMHINILKREYDTLDYFNELINYYAFELLHSSPPVTNYGEVESIKVLYDFVEDKIYYSNVKKYQSHFSFAEKLLDWTSGSSAFLWSQYNNLSNRFLNLVTINYHKNIDKYVFEFSSYDMIDCEGIKETYEKILATSYFDDKLFFYANNQRWHECLDIPMISAEELYLGQNYQALNLEENFGYLRKIDKDDLANTFLARHDLLLLNAIPNDVSVVSGIITTEFQTALSHINILSHNRKTPNMALRDGWTNPILDNLLGQLIYLKVESDSFQIRQANIDEANLFWSENEPQTPVFLELDTTTSGLVDLGEMNYFSVKTIGGKAANFAELVNLNTIPVPENSFAIPFYYYNQHMKSNGIDTVITNLLNNEEFNANIEFRHEKLDELREMIKNAPLDLELLSLVKEKINYFDDFHSFRFRSSTNAEDLEAFSGAGLYDSYTAKKNHENKTVEKAIKKVWASLWNNRAFEEREYFNIENSSIAMGVLVHRSFPDEDANGVIITKNIYNVNHAYTINVQYKEYSIVYPEPGIIHDQILTYTINLGGDDYTIEYLSHSNVPELNGQTVLTDEELFEIADYCTTIKKHYFNNIPNNCNCTYDDFAVDIEFKVDSQLSERKIYIKQVRPYSVD
jgi:hypothetical protein